MSRGGDGALEINGRAWQEDGTLSSRYWSEAMKEKQDPPGIFYFWRGERPLHPNAPQLHGTGEIKPESAERGAGYFTTLRSEEHTSELQSLMRISYAVFCLKKKSK